MLDLGSIKQDSNQITLRLWFQTTGLSVEFQKSKLVMH